MHAYYYYYNTAYYLGSDTKPLLGRCYAQELFSYNSLGVRITDSKVNLITMTRENVPLEHTYVYSYLSCCDGNQVAFDQDDTK